MAVLRVHGARVWPWLWPVACCLLPMEYGLWPVAVRLKRNAGLRVLEPMTPIAMLVFWVFCHGRGRDFGHGSLKGMLFL